MIIDLLEKSTETILHLTSAAVEHRKYNLVQTLLRMLSKVATGKIQDTKIFDLFGKNFLGSLNDSQKNVLRMLFEAGIPWSGKDGRSQCVEELCQRGCFDVISQIEELEREFNKSKNWEGLKKSETATVMLKNLIEFWSDDLDEKVGTIS